MASFRRKILVHASAFLYGLLAASTRFVLQPFIFLLFLLSLNWVNGFFPLLSRIVLGYNERKKIIVGVTDFQNQSLAKATKPDNERLTSVYQYALDNLGNFPNGQLQQSVTPNDFSLTPYDYGRCHVRIQSAGHSHFVIVKTGKKVAAMVCAKKNEPRKKIENDMIFQAAA
ncbi:hypothetical protein HS088_TW16G00207 [Tripterygium wilfordii]|uniref:Uncharacterized protein n=1 Tax=Tripterygium wilfordii TaxID=458696 RepID=A0A7J7CI93_TRIWF|nr:hypothetical protein HS088_TW16G00207 [Tripterygium wilfordii]